MENVTIHASSTFPGKFYIQSIRCGKTQWMNDKGEWLPFLDDAVGLKENGYYFASHELAMVAIARFCKPEADCCCERCVNWRCRELPIVGAVVYPQNCVNFKEKPAEPEPYIPKERRSSGTVRVDSMDIGKPFQINSCHNLWRRVEISPATSNDSTVTVVSSYWQVRYWAAETLVTPVYDGEEHRAKWDLLPVVVRIHRRSGELVVWSVKRRKEGGYVQRLDKCGNWSPFMDNNLGFDYPDKAAAEAALERYWRKKGR